MPPSLQELGLDQLAIEERLAVAEAIWDSVVKEMESKPPTPSQLDELKRRHADSVARPGVGTRWDIIRSRALAKVGA